MHDADGYRNQGKFRLLISNLTSPKEVIPLFFKITIINHLKKFNFIKKFVLVQGKKMCNTRNNLRENLKTAYNLKKVF